MKKLFVLLFIAWGTSEGAHAQAPAAPTNTGLGGSTEFHVFDAGLALGFNASQVNGDGISGFNKFGLIAGPVANINFNETFFLSFEILYSQKGSRSFPDKTIPVIPYHLVMNYAEVPVTINYNDKNRLIFGAGFAYGRLVAVHEYIDGIETTQTDNYRNDELSFLFGGTFLLGTKKHLGINFRYENSITYVGKTPQLNVKGLSNLVLSLRAIYYF